MALQKTKEIAARNYSSSADNSALIKNKIPFSTLSTDHLPGIPKQRKEAVIV